MKQLCFVLILANTVFAGTAGQKPLLGEKINWAHSLAKGLVGYWPMNEGSGEKIYDLTGRGHDGDFEGSIAWTAGKYGTCIDMPGSDGGAINFGWPDLGVSGGNEITISCWVKPDVASPVEAATITRQGNSAGNRVFYLRWTPGDDLDFYVYEVDGDNAVLARWNDCMTDQDWHHVCGIVRALDDTVTIYLDLVPVVSAEAFDDVLQSYGGGVNDMFLIGSSYAGGAIDDTWDGKIDHIQIWKRALSVSELTELNANPHVIVSPYWNWVLYGGIAAPAVGAPQVIFIN